MVERFHGAGLGTIRSVSQVRDEGQDCARMGGGSGALLRMRGETDGQEEGAIAVEGWNNGGVDLVVVVVAVVVREGGDGWWQNRQAVWSDAGFFFSFFFSPFPAGGVAWAGIGADRRAAWSIMYVVQQGLYCQHQ